MLKKLNIQSEFVNGLRVTSKDVIEVVEMVLAEEINGDLCKCYQDRRNGSQYRVKCRNLPLAKTEGEYDYGFVGEVMSVDPTAIEALLEKNIIPVIISHRLGRKDNTYNINGDTAARLAAALNADKLYLLTDIEGLCNSIRTVMSSVISIQKMCPC